MDELRDAVRKALAHAGVAADGEEIWALAVELGWLWVNVPEAHGGLGMGASAACAIHKEMGRCLAGAPNLPAMLAIEALIHSGSDKAALVGEIASGRRVAAPLGRMSLAIAGGKLSGEASGVSGAEAADRILVWADDAVLLVATADAAVRPRQCWDASRRLSDVRFDAAPIDLLLAEGEAGRALSAKLAAQRDLALAADCVGVSEALLEMTVEYLKLRTQFARPLAMFQALKHRCADLRVRVSAADALLHAAAELEGGDPASAKMAKQFAAAVGMQVAEEAVQLHGGIAVTAEHPTHLFLKRALLNQQLGDGPDREEVAIARALVASY